MNLYDVVTLYVKTVALYHSMFYFSKICKIMRETMSLQPSARGSRSSPLDPCTAPAAATGHCTTLGTSHGNGDQADVLAAQVQASMSKRGEG